MKLGLQGQLWADWTQDATGTQGYQQNSYFRRVRLIVGGDIGKNIDFFHETDDPKVGIAPKNLSAGFILQDALLEWKPSKYVDFDGGLIFVPFCRNCIQSTVSYITLDISSMSTVNNASTQSSALRDLGFQLRGFAAKDRLIYRIGAFSGQRDSNAHNSLRTAACVQYDFFDREKSYLFTGTALGKMKILAIDAGFDTQSSYHGYSANIATAMPVQKGDEVAAQFSYYHYNGQTKFLAIPNQNDYLLEAAYYFHKAKLQPFGKYEAQKFVADANLPKDIARAGFGSTYYIRGQNLKWTAQYPRALPQHTTALKPTNEFTVQLQLYSY
jgi:hypothetical protein